MDRIIRVRLEASFDNDHEADTLIEKLESLEEDNIFPQGFNLYREEVEDYSHMRQTTSNGSN